MTLVYQAVFKKWNDGDGFTVEVPDLPGCVTEGDSLAEAIAMAEDAASGWVLTELEAGSDAPKASDMNAISLPDDGSFVSLLSLDMDAYAAKYGKKSVKKTLTIPAWMDTYVTKHKISCSELLQESIDKIASA